MANDPKNPQPGDLSIDAEEIRDIVIDLAPGATQGWRREQDGFDDVVQEIFANQAAYGSRAGITEADVQSFATNNTNIARVRKYRGAVEKLAEILAETEAAFDEDRHRQISTFATAVEQRAKQKGNEDLLARYQKTREYRSAAALKGLKTRERNARKEAAGQNAGGNGENPAAK